METIVNKGKQTYAQRRHTGGNKARHHIVRLFQVADASRATSAFCQQPLCSRPLPLLSCQFLLSTSLPPVTSIYAHKAQLWSSHRRDLPPPPPHPPWRLWEICWGLFLTKLCDRLHHVLLDCTEQPEVEGVQDLGSQMSFKAVKFSDFAKRCFKELNEKAECVWQRQLYTNFVWLANKHLIV